MVTWVCCRYSDHLQSLMATLLSIHSAAEQLIHTWSILTGIGISDQSPRGPRQNAIDNVNYTLFSADTFDQQHQDSHFRRMRLP